MVDEPRVKDFFPQRPHPARRARRVAGATGGALYVALTASIGVSAYLDQPEVDESSDDTQPNEATDAASPPALALDLHGGATATTASSNRVYPSLDADGQGVGVDTTIAVPVETSTSQPASTVAAPVSQAPPTNAPTSSETTVVATQPPIASTSTEVTMPQSSQPPTTQPPTTEAPTTQPPTTQPPTTQPPTTESTTTTVVTGSS